MVTAHTLVESNTHSEWLWFNSTNMDVNFWAGRQWLDGQQQVIVKTTPATLPKVFHKEPGRMLY